MREIDANLIKKAKNGDELARFDIYSKYVVVIGKYAKKIHDAYGIDSVDELVNRGFIGLLDAIKSCDVDKVSNTYFSTYANSFIIRSMFGMQWYTVRKAVSMVEKIYGKKYICTDSDMTDAIIERLKAPYSNLISGKNAIAVEKKVLERLKEFYPVSYNDIRGVSMSDGGYGIEDWGPDKVDAGFKCVTPRQEAYIRLRYGFFPRRQLSDDEISSYVQLPIGTLEYFQRKKLRGEVLNDCEKAIMNLKKGIIPENGLRYADIGYVYDRRPQSIENSVKKGLAAMKEHIGMKNLDNQVPANKRRG